MKKIKKLKKLKNKIKGLSVELDKENTKLSDLDELDGLIADFKKETDDRYEVDVNFKNKRHGSLLRSQFLLNIKPTLSR